MDEKIIHFDAKGQKLIRTRGEHRFASGTVGYIIAEFGLDDQWENMDVIDAVWQNTKYKVAVTLVRSDGLWTCPVPHEMAQLVAEVRVNLVGKVFVNGDLVQRLTTYLEPAFVVNELANISGNTETVIPQTQFDRFVGMVDESASQARQSAESAAFDADRAEQASANAGYMYFYIDGNGDLIYQRTSNTQVDFYLQNGDLYVEATE